jgi:L-arabinokinase
VVVFYISGHGFGHASRSLEVINALSRRRPELPIAVRSSVPAWFLEDSAEAVVDLVPVEVDTGVAQIGGLQLDEAETARRARDFYTRFDEKVSAEAASLRRARATVVVGDIPPLAFAAAAAAGIPSVALGNFTWDWIYEGYPQFEDRSPQVLDAIRAAYAHATIALRLPLHGGFAPMRSVVRDLPLIARRAPLGRAGARHALGLSPDEPVVLASFGAYGAALPYAQIAARTAFTLVVTDTEGARDREASPRQLRHFTRRELRALGVRYPDLVAAADVVVSKPGYGIVSECIANGAALLYTSRGRFAEHDVFVAEMPRVLRCRFVSPADLWDGRWNEGIEELLRQEDPPERLSIDGADRAAQVILDLNGHRR